MTLLLISGGLFAAFFLSRFGRLHPLSAFSRLLELLLDAVPASHRVCESTSPSMPMGLDVVTPLAAYFGESELLQVPQGDSQILLTRVPGLWRLIFRSQPLFRILLRLVPSRWRHSGSVQEILWALVHLLQSWIPSLSLWFPLDASGSSHCLRLHASQDIFVGISRVAQKYSFSPFATQLSF